MSKEPKKIPRPEMLYGRTYHEVTGCGKVYVTVDRLDGRVFELFIRAAKAGGCMAAQTETIGRLISWQARHGLNVLDLVPYIKGISCKERIGKKTGAQSCADAIARVLEKDEAHEQEVIAVLESINEDEGLTVYDPQFFSDTDQNDPWFSVG